MPVVRILYYLKVMTSFKFVMPHCSAPEPTPRLTCCSGSPAGSVLTGSQSSSINLHLQPKPGNLQLVRVFKP